MYKCWNNSRQYSGTFYNAWSSNYHCYLERKIMFACIFARLLKKKKEEDKDILKTWLQVEIGLMKIKRAECSHVKICSFFFICLTVILQEIFRPSVVRNASWHGDVCVCKLQASVMMHSVTVETRGHSFIRATLWPNIKWHTYTYTHYNTQLDSLVLFVLFICNKTCNGRTAACHHSSICVET